MRVTLLGTGGPLRHDRARLGILVDAEDCSPVLIDTCGGFELVQRLHHAGYAIDDLTDVIVTHRHGDHIGGSMALLMQERPRRFYGPADAVSAVEELAKVTFPERGLSREVALSAVFPGGTYEVGGFSISFFEAQHRVPTYAVRMQLKDRVFAYSSDSLPCAAVVECATDADLFVCDALGSTDEGEHRLARLRTLMHPSAYEAGAMAAQAKVKTLALVHFGTNAEAGRMIADASMSFNGRILAPDDGDSFLLE